MAIVAGGLTMTGAVQGEGKPPTADQPARLTNAERQLLEGGGPAVTKVFVATLRKRFSDENVVELCKFIDPRYLKEHGLQEGAFRPRSRQQPCWRQGRRRASSSPKLPPSQMEC